MGVRQCGVRASARARTGPVTTATYRAMPAMVFTRARWPDGVRGSGERAGFRDRTAGARPWSGGTGRARPRSQAACRRALDRQVRRLLGGRHGHSPRNRALARATPALSASVTVMGRKVSGPAFYSLRRRWSGAARTGPTKPITQPVCRFWVSSTVSPEASASRVNTLGRSRPSC